MSDKYLIKVKIEEESPVICTSDIKYNIHDKVIVTLEDISYFSNVLSCVENNLQDDKVFGKVIRLASKEDVLKNEDLLKGDKILLPQIQKEANKLNLDMAVYKVVSSFDKTKCKIFYTSDNRVDFRELLKVLAKMIKARIELKQVGPRDKAKSIGGLGVCGLKLCCSTFLTSFDVISISMAKNQMLTINIPKLSGQCGKLICCLKYEDVNYSKLHPLFPKIGSQVTYMNTKNTVNSVNMLNSTVVLYDGSKYTTLSLNDFNKVLKGVDISKDKKEDAPISYADSFSMDISSTNNQNNGKNTNNKFNNKGNINKNNNKNFNKNYRNNKNNNRFNKGNSNGHK